MGAKAQHILSLDSLDYGEYWIVINYLKKDLHF
jgi:hypothetical protein